MDAEERRLCRREIGKLVKRLIREDAETGDVEELRAEETRKN